MKKKKLTSFYSKNYRKKAKKKGRGILKSIKRKKRRIKKVKSRLVKVYSLNPEFEFFNELRNLILKSPPSSQEQMLKRISRLGRIKLIVISGIFLNISAGGGPASGLGSPTATDLLIVGDEVDKRKLRNFLKLTESEVGKEISFALMNKEEFDYRRKMFDRFIRVLLEGPHKVLLDRVGLTGA